MTANDAVFVAASRTAVPDLIAEVRLLRSVLGDVQEDGHFQVRQVERLRRCEAALMEIAQVPTNPTSESAFEKLRRIVELARRTLENEKSEDAHEPS